MGQSLLWGPTPEGGFSPVKVTCIQRSHIAVRQIAPGQTATLALHPTVAGLPHSGSKQALLTAAAVAQAAAAEAAAREAAAAIAAVPEPIAKTRRRSPAALQAAAAAAASAAATAAAAADAARRAAETAGGRAWWLQPGAAGVGSADAGPCPAAAGGGLQAGAALGSGPNVDVGDLLDDSFAAELAADGSSDSDADLFGPNGVAGLCGGSSGRGSPVVAAAAAAGVAGGDAEGDLFAGLADVFGGDEEEDGDGQPSPVRNRSSSGSSTASSTATSSSSGLVESWSFSSASSSRDRQPGTRTDSAASCGAPAAAAAAGSAPVSIAGALRSRSALSGLSSSEQLLGCSPSRWRTKGGVLLDAGAAPHTYWEFEALLVLLGGVWPPRGLLSGTWPPEQDPPQAPTAAGADGTLAGTAEATEGAAGAASGEAPSSTPALQRAHSRGRKQRRSSRLEFAYVVHCNSIRQIARVVCMQELRGGAGAEGEEDVSQEQVTSSSVPPGECAGVQQEQDLRQQQLQQHCGLTASIRAAAALLQGASAHASDRDGEEGGSSEAASGDSSGEGPSRQQRQRRLGSGGSVRRPSAAGSVVAVRFRFTHRPEWMQVGARLIARDRSDGHVAAAGFVTKLLEPHTQLQQHQRELQGAKGKPTC